MFTQNPLTETNQFTWNFQIDFIFIMQIGKGANIFLKNPLKMYLVRTFKIVRFGVVIDSFQVIGKWLQH